MPDLICYKTKAGREPVTKWLGELDAAPQGRVKEQIEALRTQDFTSDHRLPSSISHLRDPNRPLDAGPCEAMYELRVKEKRVYFAREDNGDILLLGAGTTDTSKRDIGQARERCEDHKVRTAARAESRVDTALLDDARAEMEARFGPKRPLLRSSASARA